ncbi:MAG: CHRD domain-containing protein [Burkholderiales bacterium]|nr:CHRD domain-containing protein [Burkholderiales bacterium]
MKAFITKSLFLRGMLLLLVALTAGCGGGDDARLRFIYSASLDGAQEVPPNASAGRGTGVLIVDPTDNAFTASIVTTGVADNAAHVHEGVPGTAGPVVIPLTKAQGSVVWTASGTLTAAQLASLERGDYYFNVHSPTFPAGEIRGQLQRRAPTAEQLQQLQQFVQQSDLLRTQLDQIRQQQ